MAVSLSLIGGAGWQFFDDSGSPLSGGKIYTYAAGTTTPLTTYTSRDGLTPNANPIILDAAGRTPQQIWSTEGLLYKYTITKSNDVQIRVWDNIGGTVVANDLSTDLANTTDNAKGDALIGFRQSNSSGFLTGATARTVNDKLQENISVKDFGAVGDGVADDTAEIQAAFDALDPVRGGVLVFPPGRYKISNTITLPRTTTGTGVYEIYGYGARIETTAAIKMFERTVADNTVANQIIGDRFVFAGLEFYGNQQSAQWGIKLGATYGSVLRECRFSFLGTGLDLLFCLNSTVEQCFTTFCGVDAFVARSGDWTGAGVNTSQSNVSVFRNCRDYGTLGQNASYKILASSGMLIENCISEGFNHAYGVYFDYESSTTVKNFFVRNFHCEHTPTIAGCRVITAGIAEIDGWWQQTLGVMVDSTGTAASGLLVVRNLAYTAGGAVFTHGGTSARWLFQNCIVGDIFSTAKWTDGTLPAILQQIANVAQPAFSDIFLSLYGLNGVVITSKNAPLVIESDAKAISTNLHVAATTLGSVVARLALRDSATNAVVGYVPIYNTIT